MTLGQTADSGTLPQGYGELLVSSLMVLVVVCVVAWVVVRFGGRWVASARGRGSRLLEVVARLPLEPRRSLYVVEVAGKTLLVGTSEMGLSVLSELDGAVIRAELDRRPAGGFAELVRRALERRRSAATTMESAGRVPGAEEGVPGTSEPVPDAAERHGETARE